MLKYTLLALHLGTVELKGTVNPENLFEILTFELFPPVSCLYAKLNKSPVGCIFRFRKWSDMSGVSIFASN